MKIRLAEGYAYTLEKCKCGQHPRILAVADLMAAWRKRKA